ncbi:MAG: hypothetical protein IKS87_02625 [Lachnospiraceae bacterium]|nr:hypothetical protein [Clostridia bacterium]MBR5930457.1 hypothetical protein [Lachnospiraceae bacterium]MBR6451575.1 hypothetical protein [Lachnospiraceae bacterium]
MPSIVYQVDKKTGIKYAYESTSYWDKEKKQPRSKRRYIGKVDPETGEIIPCRKETAPITEEDAAEIIRLRTAAAEQEKKISLLEAELSKANAALAEQAGRLKEIAKLAKVRE